MAALNTDKENDMQKTRVLVVDNTPEDSEEVRDYLEREGLEVFQASTAEEAKRIMDGAGADIIIIDLRLKNNRDPKDFSGITLAKQINPSVPKIIWTSFPTYEAVREALGPNFNGIPPAAGFVSKADEEGLPALLNAIKLALSPADTRLARSVLRAFDVEAPVALHHRIREFGAEETSARMRQSLAGVSEELVGSRETENHRASQWHMTGLVAGWVGLALVVITIILLLRGSVGGGMISLVASGVINVVRNLFSAREDAAHRRVSESYQELESINRAANLLTICESLESSRARDTYRKKLLDHMFEKGWLFEATKK